MSAPIFRPLGFGEILDGAFTMYRRNLVPFLLSALLPTLVLMGLMAAFGPDVFSAMISGDPQQFLGVLGPMFLSGVAGGLVYMVMWAALTREAAQAYLGQPATVGDGFGTALGRLPAVIGSAIVAGIALFVVFFGLMMVLGVMTGVLAASGSAGAAVVLTAVGMVGAVVVYLLAIALLFAVLPAIIVEGKGPVEAIARSFDLARGALWRVLGLMVVTLVIVYLPGMAVGMVTGGFADVANPDAVPTAGKFLTQQLLGLGVSVLTTPFMAAVIVLLYFDRRVRTEALDVQMAAERLAAAS